MWIFGFGTVRKLNACLGFSPSHRAWYGLLAASAAASALPS